MNPHLYCIILCGGSGTRLWPLSRKNKPKQYLNLGGAEHSLLQASVDRIKNICPRERIWCVTAEGQEDWIHNQLGDSVGRILSEPAARNTAAAVAWSAWELLKVDPNAIMFIMSADQAIHNINAFQRSIEQALCLAEKDYFVTLGIVPTYPATGFGYIEKAQAIFDTSADKGHLGFEIARFHEKPPIEKATSYLKTGQFLWNAGMFVWKARHFWDDFSLLQPEMSKTISSMNENIKNVYTQLENIPIDIAFMEKTKRGAVVPALFDWNDVGSWQAVLECFDNDKQGNNLSGDVYSLDNQNCLLQSDGIFLACIGLKELAVVATKDAVLVMPLDRSQDVKTVTQYLAERNPQLL